MANFVLVPGAWLGSWVWKKIIPLMTAKGHQVYPVTLKGMGERVHLASPALGIDTIIQDVLNVIKYNDVDNFVLVGHSFAGKVAAAVADRVPERVTLLLYLDAFRPEKGVRTPQASLSPTELGWAGEATIPFTEQILDTIGKDVQGRDRDWMLSKATPWPAQYATDSVTYSEKFDSVKEAFIFCRGSGDPVDEIIAGKWGKLDGPYKVMECGHWPMVTQPEELVRDMLELCKLK